MVIDVEARERIVAVETQLKAIAETQKETNTKLDDLVALKQKGLGAFWLATTLAGIVFYLISSSILSLFKG